MGRLTQWHPRHAGLCDYKNQQPYGCALTHILGCAHTRILAMQVCVITKYNKNTGAHTTHSLHTGPCNYKIQQKCWCAQTHILIMHVFVITKCNKNTGVRTHTCSHVCARYVCARTHWLRTHTHSSRAFSSYIQGFEKNIFLFSLYIQGFEKNVSLVLKIWSNGCVCAFLLVLSLFIELVCVRTSIFPSNVWRNTGVRTRTFPASRVAKTRRLPYLIDHFPQISH